MNTPSAYKHRRQQNTCLQLLPKYSIPCWKTCCQNAPSFPFVLFVDYRAGLAFPAMRQGEAVKQTLPHVRQVYTGDGKQWGHLNLSWQLSKSPTQWKEIWNRLVHLLRVGNRGICSSRWSRRVAGWCEGRYSFCSTCISFFAWSERLILKSYT